jgi:hypothetical protein
MILFDVDIFSFCVYGIRTGALFVSLFVIVCMCVDEGVFLYLFVLNWFVFSIFIGRCECIT